MSRYMVLALVGIFWAAVGVFALVVSSNDALKQVAACGYTSVDALILESEIVSRYGAKNDWTGTWVVRYSYVVHGRTYESTQQAYTGDRTFRDVRRAEAHAAAWPPSSVRPAFVNPRDPQDAVLWKGATAIDFVPSAVVLAMLAGGVVLLIYTASGVAGGAAARPAAGLPIVETGGSVSVSVSGVSPFECVAFVAVPTAFGATIACGALAGRSITLLAIGLAVVVLVTAAASVSVWKWANALRVRPRVLVTFDRRAATLSLPPTDGRSAFALFPCERVVEVREDPFQQNVRGAAGTKTWRVTGYLVSVEVIDEKGTTVRYPVRTFGKRDDSNGFANWCRERLLESAQALGQH